MNTEDIIAMAREAGFEELFDNSSDWVCFTDEIEKFAALVAAAEREACAKVCEAQENKVVQRHPARIEFDPNSIMARSCAAAIRARSNT